MTKEKKEIDSLDELFDEENVPESNWFKMEKVGDRVSGEVVGITEKPAKDDFPAQRVFDLQQKDGSVIKYGAKYPKMIEGKMVGSDYLVSRTKNVKLGDLLGFEFTKEFPAPKKGYAKAKSITVYVKHIEKKIDEEINADDIEV